MSLFVIATFLVLAFLGMPLAFSSVRRPSPACGWQGSILR